MEGSGAGASPRWGNYRSTAGTEAVHSTLGEGLPGDPPPFPHPLGPTPVAKLPRMKDADTRPLTLPRSDVEHHALHGHVDGPVFLGSRREAVRGRGRGRGRAGFPG